MSKKQRVLDLLAQGETDLATIAKAVDCAKAYVCAIRAELVSGAPVRLRRVLDREAAFLAFDAGGTVESVAKTFDVPKRTAYSLRQEWSAARQRGAAKPNKAEQIRALLARGVPRKAIAKQVGASVYYVHDVAKAPVEGPSGRNASRVRVEESIAFRPSAAALADRERRFAMGDPRDLVGVLMGDPLPGRSALDQRVGTGA